MPETRTVERAAATKTAVTGGMLLLAWGAGTGLLVGLFLVRLLGWLGLHIDTGTRDLLHRAFLS